MRLETCHKHDALARFSSSSTNLLAAGEQVARDLNGNGKLDVYEDPRAPVEERVDDLLQQMTVAEKVGLMFHAMAAAPGTDRIDGRIKIGSAHLSEMVTDRYMNHFNLVLTPDATKLAHWHNRVQQLAESTRLGIPVTIASDPRHAAVFNPGAGIKQPGFSEWPSQLGLAASGDESLVELYAEIGRCEFMATGIRTILNPMADVASEPRWGRIGGTFGEDFCRVGQLTAAYIRGFQNGDKGLHRNSVSCMVKHFPGCGPVEEGTEPHFRHGAHQIYPAGRLRDHLEPFKAAIAAGARQIMLSYGVPVGQTSEDVAMAFNHDIVQGLLREELGFDGVVCTDWLTHETETFAGILKLKEASAWGVEHLSVEERYIKSIEAGVDQFGGQSNPAVLCNLVETGRISEQRIDESARRILRIKFALGLFDNPYVQPDLTGNQAGTKENIDAGLEAQRRSMVLLSNGEIKSEPFLPLKGKPKIYVENIDKEEAGRFGEVVNSPRNADVAILNLVAPSELKLSTEILKYFFAEGDLRFSPRKLKKILNICKRVPTVVNIRLDRPAVIPEISAEAKALFVSFCVSDAVLLEAVFGEYSPSGRLPVELPSSMEAVIASPSDSPGTEAPLYPQGHGLSYSGWNCD